MDSEQSLDIPLGFVQITRCFAKDELEDGKSLIGLCTTSGQLLELIDKKINDTFDIDKDADDITIFTSYNPVQKYYLIRCKQELIVVKRHKPLCVIKKYENVVRVEIRDRLHLGWPQAVIWTRTDTEPIVTDFVGQLHPAGPQPVPSITSGLSAKLQEMNLRLVKARKLLEERRSAREQAMYQLTPHLQPLESQTQGEGKVLVWGPALPPTGEWSQPPLQLSRPWCRAHNGKWIVGVAVLNTSNTIVDDVRLRLKTDSQTELRYETYVVLFPQRVSSGAEWTELRHHGALFQTQQSIPSNSTATIVGVVEEPHFRQSSAVTVSGAVLYRSSDQPSGTSVQEPLEPVQFKVQDLVQGALRPFSSHESADESDVVSVALTSRRWRLRVISCHRMSASLHLSECGLQWVAAVQCWIGNSLGTLAGLLLIHRPLSDSQHLLEIYAKDTKQALQLVRSLSSEWRVEEWREPAASLADCVQSLAAELKLLLTTAQPGSQFTAAEWAEVRDRLSTLELATDSSFLSYSPPPSS